LGAALVFFARSVHQTLLDIMLGFAAGVMIAASFWSLLAPSIEMASAQGMPKWLPPTVGFLSIPSKRRSAKGDFCGHAGSPRGERT
jgi:zinc transporter, ZIP family